MNINILFSKIQQYVRVLNDPSQSSPESLRCFQAISFLETT